MTHFLGESPHDVIDFLSYRETCHATLTSFFTLQLHSLVSFLRNTIILSFNNPETSKSCSTQIRLKFTYFQHNFTDFLEIEIIAQNGP